MTVTDIIDNPYVITGSRNGNLSGKIFHVFHTDNWEPTADSFKEARRVITVYLFSDPVSNSLSLPFFLLASCPFYTGWWVNSLKSLLSFYSFSFLISCWLFSPLVCPNTWLNCPMSDLPSASWNIYLGIGCIISKVSRKWSQTPEVQ